MVESAQVKDSRSRRFAHPDRGVPVGGSFHSILRGIVPEQFARVSRRWSDGLRALSLQATALIGAPRHAHAGMSPGALPAVSARPDVPSATRSANLAVAAKAVGDNCQPIGSDVAAIGGRGLLAAPRHGGRQGASTRTLQGVSFDSRAGSEVVRYLDECIEQDRPTRVAIANAHTLNLARTRPEYRQQLSRFLVLNDGCGVEIASRWRYGCGFPENLNGTDFVPRYLTATKRRLRVFLLGAHPDVVKRAVAECEQRFPQHAWVGCRDGYFSSADDATICQQIRDANVDLLLVAMGNPLQESWIARCSEASGARISIGVGALFDFLAGNARRAPRWVQGLRCEWIFRLVHEPKRLWRRYLIGNFTFLWAAWQERQ